MLRKRTVTPASHTAKARFSQVMHVGDGQKWAPANRTVRRGQRFRRSLSGRFHPRNTLTSPVRRL